jgi:hypothetical protein
MRVFPLGGITAPLFPFEKSYSFFIRFALLGPSRTNRD